jgi:hypothetical protein
VLAKKYNADLISWMKQTVILTDTAPSAHVCIDVPNWLSPDFGIKYVRSLDLDGDFRQHLEEVTRPVLRMYIYSQIALCDLCIWII